MALTNAYLAFLWHLYICIPRSADKELIVGTS
jgi:hypothetical protein